jgi:hypothetical protein
LTVTVLFLWGALSDERMGLSFVYAAGSSQHSLSRVRVPWYSRPCFAVSDLRLPISSPLTTRRVTVEVFNPASTRVALNLWLSSRYIAAGRTTQKTVCIVEVCLPNCCIAAVLARIPYKTSHMITILPVYWHADCCQATSYKYSYCC